MIAVSEIKTEADALQAILAWSKDRPPWQRDALRRLVVHGELSVNDIDQLTALCKDSSLASEPLAEGHITAQRSGAPTVALKNMRGVQNVNALTERQTLNFIPKGITIVYGDNGAGKSGYVRVLKNACRARTVRGGPEVILPNIYTTQPGPQCAELEYHAGEEILKAEWKNGEATDDLLSEISVFDSRTANVHVEETNNLAYTPFPMRLLEWLVKACRAVKDKVENEISSIEKQTPESISEPSCLLSTAVGKLITSLSESTKDESVGKLAALSETELAQLVKLTSDFATDPKATARRLHAQKTKLQTLRSKLESLAAAIMPDNGQKLADLAAKLSIKSAAARLAVQDFSKNQPLSGVGSEAWRELWEAARAYSEAKAYPKVDFPNTAEDGRCVLCQQELDQSAAMRLRRFEAFVQDRTQREEDIARQDLDGLKNQLEKTGVPRADLLQWHAFLAEELRNAKLASAVRKFVVRAQWRLRAMRRSNSDVEHSVPLLADTGLDRAIIDQESRAEALLADDESDERNKLRTELDELKDRQWLAGIKEDVLAQIVRSKSIAKLQTALKHTKSNAITSKSTSLSQALITEQLRASFAQEIDHLEPAGPDIELTQESSRHGGSRFKVSLTQSASPDARVGDVLSEGEHRCVALAAFMAELATNNSDSGIVFDDPVSSLDHLRREAIAKRLAKEGRRRQVVVFTHDLPFLFLLRKACTQVDDPAQKTEIALRHVKKQQGVPGYCKNEAPEKAKDALSSLKTMRAHLKNTRTQYDQDTDEIEWLTTARGLIDNLRQTWEMAVEDAISPVLRTFSSRVDTKGFAKLSAITQQDAEIMRKHYRQCSALLHKASDEMNPSVPKPEEIETELEAIEIWLKKVKECQKEIKAP